MKYGDTYKKHKMSITYTPLELAKEKALEERSILFYQKYESTDYKISYGDSVFYNFVSKEDFLEELKCFIESKSDTSNLCAELWKIDDELIYLKVDVWKNLYVVSCDDKVKLFEFEKDVEELIG